MSLPTGYKPSPLGLGSQRSSPFRTPTNTTGTPPSALVPTRQFTPTTSPTRISSLCTPSRLASSAATANASSTPVTPTPITKAAASSTAITPTATASSIANKTPVTPVAASTPYTTTPISKNPVTTTPAAATSTTPLRSTPAFTTSAVTTPAFTTSAVATPTNPTTPAATTTTTPLRSTYTTPAQATPRITTTNATPPTPENESRTPRNPGPSYTYRATTPPPSRSRVAMAQPATSSPQAIGNSSSALSQLLPAQVRVLRDSFQIMDRDSDGIVSREDVVDMLTQLGLSAKPSEIAQFFPPGGPQNLTLASFLNSIATPLAALSPASELLSAFSAFDDDDSGQVDVVEIREALLRTPPEPGEHVLTAGEVDKIIGGFSGRRAFSKSSMTGGGGLAAHRRGDVFRYQEFVNAITGVGGAPDPKSGHHEEEEED